MPGIKVLPVKNMSATATRIESTTVIGVVGTAVTTNFSDGLKATLADNKNLLRFNSAEEALVVFADVKGTIREDLWDIDRQNVKSPIVISLVAVTEDHLLNAPQEFYGDAQIKTDIELAVNNLKFSRTIYGYATKVRIAIASWFSNDITIYNALEVLATDTKTIAIRDLHLTTVAEALPALEALGSRRQLVFPFYRRAWSVYENATIEKPNSAIVAGHIAYWDSMLGEFGFCFDHANRNIQDVESTTTHLDYEEGLEECAVNIICNAGGAVLLNDDGWKLYNFETPLDDERFNKLDTIRFFDGISESLQRTLVKHKHRPMTDVFNLAKADAEAFMGKAVKAGSAVGARTRWSDQNTPEEVAVGTIYMDYIAGNNLGMRTMVIQPLATNEYYAIENLTQG